MSNTTALSFRSSHVTTTALSISEEVAIRSEWSRPLSGCCVDPAAPLQALAGSSGGSDFLNFSGHPTLSSELPGRRHQSSTSSPYHRSFLQPSLPAPASVFPPYRSLPINHQPPPRPRRKANDRQNAGPCRGDEYAHSALPRSCLFPNTLADMNPPRRHPER
jgi:hypothetical protein